MSNEYSTGKSIVVLAIVVGCFAILWPKIFYPMFQAAITITTSKPDVDSECKNLCFIEESPPYICDIFSQLQDDNSIYQQILKQSLCKKNILEICNIDVEESHLNKQPNDIGSIVQELKLCQENYQEKRLRHIKRSENFRTSRPAHLHSGESELIHKEAKERERLQRREGRPFPHPSARQATKPQPKSSGTMGLLMPVYTIIIIVFFLYTILKAMKKPDEEEKKPIVKDFHMDPEYRKFVLSEQYNNGEEVKLPSSKKKSKEIPKEPVVEEDESDSEDYEIYQLRKKLQETEAAMERIMKHMGTVSECLATTMAASVPHKNDLNNRPQDLKLISKNAPSEPKCEKLSTSDLKEESMPTSPNVESYELIDESPIEEESPSIEEIESDVQISPSKSF